MSATYCAPTKTTIIIAVVGVVVVIPKAGTDGWRERWITRQMTKQRYSVLVETTWYRVGAHHIIFFLTFLYFEMFHNKILGKIDLDLRGNRGWKGCIKLSPFPTSFASNSGSWDTVAFSKCLLK